MMQPPLPLHLAFESHHRLTNIIKIGFGSHAKKTMLPAESGQQPNEGPRHQKASFNNAA
jgi:hypothetical protein